MSSWVAREQFLAWSAPSVVAWQLQLSQVTGWEVRIGTAQRLPDGGTQLLDLIWSDPETGVEVLRAQRLDILPTPTSLDLIAAHVELQAGHGAEIWDTVRERALRAPAAGLPAWRLMLQHAVWHTHEAPLAIAEGHLLFEPAETGHQLFGELRLAGNEAATPVQLRIKRNRQMTPPATSLQLHTGGAAIPCTLLAEYVPELSRLGFTAAFTGELDAILSHVGCEADVQGRLSAVNLDTLVTGQFPHKLSGWASIELTGVHFAGSRLRAGRGSVVAEQGVVSQSLLQAAQQHLAVHLAPRITERPASLWPYQDLQLSFALRDERLALTGTCDTQGTLLRDAHGPLAQRTEAEPAPVLALVRSLVPPSALLAPATRETESLLRLLPIPAVVPARETPQVGRYVPLRLRASEPTQPR